MQNNKKVILTMFTFLLITLLVACNHTTNKSSPNTNSPSQNDSTSQNTDTDLTGDTQNTDSNHNDENEEEKENVNKELENEEHSSTVSNNLKEEFLQKLNDYSIEASQLEAADSSTYALKKVENERWELWDGLLNEIYGALYEQLPSEEFEQLREEQRNWIDYRDETALEASQQYKGGTMEHLEYVSVLANVTEERCFELVEVYMN